MTVYFGNAGFLDLDTIRIMGVSVKETDNPIGYFGTGLKYAIATILRNGCKIALSIGSERYEFTARETTVRGEPFSVVFMNEEQLGFTTELGKNWELWQAYRELHSNCLDEFDSAISTMLVEKDTVISVYGAAFEEVFHKRHEIFLASDPAWVTPEVEVHRGTSKYLYYRGVRVKELETSSRFTYNLISPVKLTEDRTLASEWDAIYALGYQLPTIPDKEFCSKIADPEWDGYERKSVNFNYCTSPSEEMLDVIEAQRDNQKLDSGFKKLLQEKRKVSTVDKYEATPNEWNDIDAARSLISRHLNVDWSGVVIHPVESLGPNIYAMVESGEIYITRQTIANGVDFLAITLYEEWIHLRLGHRDETRGMQQFLFDKILELIKR